MSWQFGVINGKLAEVFFKNKKILGFCYVSKDRYTTRKERGWIKNDTKKLRLSYRQKMFRDVCTGKIVPQTTLKY